MTSRIAALATLLLLACGPVVEQAQPHEESPTMAVVYTGTDAAIPADRSDVQITNPVDADAPTAASVATATEKLANYGQRIIKKAGFLDLASTWTEIQTFAKGIIAKGATYADPAIEDDSAIGADQRRLVFRTKVGSGNAYLRMYRSQYGGLTAFEFSVNARWSENAGGQWIPDVTAVASYYGWANTSYFMQRKLTATAGVAFTSWDSPQISFGAMNVGASTNVSNALYAKNIPKAFGHITTAWGGVGTATLEDGFNSSIVYSNGPPAQIAVTFGSPMANANYALSILASKSRLNGTDVFVPIVTARSVSGFTFQMDSSAGLAIGSMFTGSVDYDFHVFGEQAF